MKSLTLIRHAKSSWSDMALSDHDRPLNGRGKRDAPMMGDVLEARGFEPDLMVTSTAVRARTTCEVIASAIGFPADKIIDESQIYHAGVSALMLVISQLDETVGSAVLFGHNPGFHDLVNTLVAGHPIDHYPTCAVAMMDLAIEHWAEVAEGCASLREYLIPKQFV